MCREINIKFECYTINDDGTVFSKYWNKQLFGCFDKDGYTFIKMKLKNGKYDQFRLHRVIWVYFNGEIPDGLEIDHIIPLSNGGTNELSNLRLVIPKENSNNQLSKINMSKSQKGHKSTISKNNKKLSQAVIRIKPNGEIIEYPSAKEAERSGLNQSSISRHCNGGYFSKGKWYNSSKYYKGDIFYWKSDYYS